MARTSQDTKQWLTLGEASQLLGVHQTTLREWVNAGRVSSFRTPGGHRRFDVRDLQVFLQQRRTGSAKELQLYAVNPLSGVRQQFDASQISRQEWYQHLSPEHLIKDREIGRRMLGLLIQYSSRRENAEHFLEEGRALARQYGKDYAALGFSPSNLVRAFLFVRTAILNATHQTRDTAAPHDVEGMRLYQRINGFMDEMLLSTLEAYDQARGEEQTALEKLDLTQRKKKSIPRSAAMRSCP